jgi:hypothetical protein
MARGVKAGKKATFSYCHQEMSEREYWMAITGNASNL